MVNLCKILQLCRSYNVIIKPKCRQPRKIFTPRYGKILLFWCFGEVTNKKVRLWQVNWQKTWTKGIQSCNKLLKKMQTSLIILTLLTKKEKRKERRLRHNVGEAMVKWSFFFHKARRSKNWSGLSRGTFVIHIHSWPCNSVSRNLILRYQKMHTMTSIQALFMIPKIDTNT